MKNENTTSKDMELFAYRSLGSLGELAMLVEVCRGVGFAPEEIGEMKKRHDIFYEVAKRFTDLGHTTTSVN